MAELFRKDVRTIREHIRTMFDEKELQEGSVIRKFQLTAADRKLYDTRHDNPDVINSDVEAWLQHQTSRRETFTIQWGVR